MKVMGSRWGSDGNATFCLSQSDDEGIEWQRKRVENQLTSVIRPLSFSFMSLRSVIMNCASFLLIQDLNRQNCPM